MVVLLFVLKTSKNPSCLALVKVVVLVVFDRQNPSSNDKVPALVFAEVYVFIDFMVLPRLDLVCFCLGKLILVLSELCCLGFLGLAKGFLLDRWY